MDLSILSDLHKDARGFRPSVDYTTWFAGLPKENQAREWDSLSKELKDNEEREAAEQKDSLGKWEDHMLGLMRVHNIEKKDAVKWDMESEEIVIRCGQDVDHYCFINNLPQDSWSEVRQLMGF